MCRIVLREDSPSSYDVPWRSATWYRRRRDLDIINLNILGTGALVLALAPVLVELEVAVPVAFLAVGVCLVDLRALGEFAVGLQGAGLVGGVLEDHVALLVLVVAERQQDDVALVDPDLLAQLAADVGQALGAVEA